MEVEEAEVQFHLWLQYHIEVSGYLHATAALAPGNDTGTNLIWHKLGLDVLWNRKF